MTYVHSTMAKVADTIQNDEALASLEGMKPVVRRLRSALSENQENDNQLASRIATLPTNPQTLVPTLERVTKSARLRGSLSDRIVERLGERAEKSAR
jgi:hypothetical protein